MAIWASGIRLSAAGFGFGPHPLQLGQHAVLTLPRGKSHPLTAST